MRNSVLVIFGLAAGLFAAGSDSAAVREERVKRASDVVSKFTALLGDEISKLGIPIKPEESLVDKRFFYRNSPFYDVQSLPDSVLGLGAALGQLEADVEEVASQIKELIMPHEKPHTEEGRSNTYMYRSKSNSRNAFSTVIKAISKLGKTIAKHTPPIVVSPDINQAQGVGGGPSTYYRQRNGPSMYYYRQRDDPDNVPEVGTIENLPINIQTISALLKKILHILDPERYPDVVAPLPFDPVTFPDIVATLPFDPMPFPDVVATLPFDPVPFPDVVATLPFDPVPFPDVVAPLPFDPFPDTPVDPVPLPEDTPADVPVDPENPPTAPPKPQNLPAIPPINPITKSVSNEFGRPRPSTKPKPKPVPSTKPKPKPEPSTKPYPVPSTKPYPVPSTKPYPVPSTKPYPVPSTKPYPPEGVPDAPTEPTEIDEKEEEATQDLYENGMTEDEDGTYNLVPAVFRLRMKKN